MVHALHEREVSLGCVNQCLKGVVAVGHEPIMVGGSGGRAAVVGALPNPADTDSEVQAFVKSLLEHDRIQFNTAKRRAAVGVAPFGKATHLIQSVAGKKVLRRIRFQCCG